MYISKVVISNYKAFKTATVKFEDGLNVIIGHNNGGKSTLLDAISLVIDSNRNKKLSVWDFNQGIPLEKLKENSPSIEISLYFTMSEGEENISSDVALLSTYAIELEPQLESCITYTFFLPSTELSLYKQAVADIDNSADIFRIIESKFIRKYTYSIIGGKPSLHQQVSSEDLHKIDYQKVDALRNVEEDLFSGRATLLHDVLSYFLDYDIKTSEKTEDEKTHEINSKRELFKTETDKNINTLVNRIKEGKDQIVKYANSTGALYNESDLIFDGSVTEEQLLRVLNILVSNSAGFNTPIGNNGLGYNNLIYISLLLAKMQSNKETTYMGVTNAKAFSVLSIEEPEAHLHPELQYQFLDFLRRNIADNKVKQVFMTSHSPSLTAKVKLDELCNLIMSESHEIKAYYPRDVYKDFPKSKSFVQRYLDATRADMLFAGKVLFVEGLAEQILIPVFVDILGYTKQWLTQQAVIVNIGGRYFDHFLKMYDNSKEYSLPIRVACLTDRDPVRRKKETSESFTKCWPVEYDQRPDSFDYKNHSEEFVNQYKSNDSIHFFSQDEKGKTLEYEIARVNYNNKTILVDSISNKEELSLMMQTKSFDEAKNICKSDDLNKIYSENINWEDNDKLRGLISARYLKSLQKGENALELANSLQELSSDEKKKIVVPNYIKMAIEWLLNIK